MVSETAMAAWRLQHNSPVAAVNVLNGETMARNNVSNVWRNNIINCNININQCGVNSCIQ